MAAAMAQRPQASLAQQAGDWSATIGAYRLLRNARVTPASLREPAAAWTRQACESCAVVLCVHDLTELDPTYELSPTQLQQHTVLAVDGGPGGRLLGLLHQQIFDDPQPARSETRPQRRERWRRSQTWADAVAAVGSAPGSCRFITVADREADDFQTFTACLAHGHGFVIRSQHDRVVRGDARRRRVLLAEQPVAGGMIQVVAGRSAVGIAAPPKRRRSSQAPRDAKLTVQWAALTLAPPAGDPRFERGLAVHAVWVTECQPSAEVQDPIDWPLLTSEPVTNLTEALRIVQWYRRRWIIEEFHKAQKTGCRLEQSQPQDADAFKRLAALGAGVAVHLLQLRDQADDPITAHQSAQLHLDTLAVQVVSRLAKHPDPATLTIQQFHHTLAKLGGWLARKHDGRPGWQTLWRGWQLLSDYLTGIQLYLANPPT